MGVPGFFTQVGAIRNTRLTGRDTSNLIRIGGRSTGEGDETLQTHPGLSEEATEEKGGEWSDLMATLQSLDAPVFAVDAAGVIIAWSAKLAQLTGVPAVEMIGKGNQEYAIPFYGKPGYMLIDHIIRPREVTKANLSQRQRKSAIRSSGKKNTLQSVAGL